MYNIISSITGNGSFAKIFWKNSIPPPPKFNVDCFDNSAFTRPDTSNQNNKFNTEFGGRGAVIPKEA